MRSNTQGKGIWSPGKWAFKRVFGSQENVQKQCDEIDTVIEPNLL